MNTAGQHYDQAVPSEIYITDELALRPARKADYRLEKLALQDLMTQLHKSPEEVLTRFVDIAMELTGGVASGLSLSEDVEGKAMFRWRHLRGTLAVFENSLTPRNYSPCGVTLNQSRPVLTRHSERFYTWIADTKVTLPEVLLVPIYSGDNGTIGTLWIVSDEAGHFDSGDARVASELATFVSIALNLAEARRSLEKSLEQQETLTKEMSHRVQNLFAIAEGLVRVTKKSSDTKDEMAEALIGRFHALAGAHSLIRRSFSTEPNVPRVYDLNSLLRAIVKPHEEKDGFSRFEMDGPAIALGEHAINGIALTFHELATNAAKHGALKTDEGRISVTWDVAGDDLRMTWTERGGSENVEHPAREGFGSKLLNDTITRQFSGAIEHHWDQPGLRVTLSLPLKHLAN